jgi:MFS family permease
MFFISELGESLIFPILPELFMNNKFGLILGNSHFSREIFYSMSFILFPLGSLIGMPTLGVLSDKVGKNKIIFYGMLATSITYLLLSFSIVIHNIWLFLLCRLINGFLCGIYFVGMALISYYCNNSQERISRFKLPIVMSITGMICGPGLSIIVNIVNFNNPLLTPFIVAFVLSMINSLLLCYNYKNSQENHINISLLKSDQPRTRTLTKNLIKENKDRSGISEILKLFLNSMIYTFINKKFKTLAVSFFLFQFACGLFLQSLSLYLASKYHYIASQIGQFFLLMVIAILVSMYLLQNLAIKFIKYKTQAHIGLLLLSILFISQATLSDNITSILQISDESLTWFISAAFHLFMPFVSLCFNNLFATSGKKLEQGRIMGSLGQIQSIALIISGSLIGKLITSYNLLLILTGISFLLSNIILIKIKSNNVICSEPENYF